MPVPRPLFHLFFLSSFFSLLYLFLSSSSLLPLPFIFFSFLLHILSSVRLLYLLFSFSLWSFLFFFYHLLIVLSSSSPLPFLFISSFPFHILFMSYKAPLYVHMWPAYTRKLETPDLVTSSSSSSSPSIQNMVTRPDCNHAGRCLTSVIGNGKWKAADLKLD